MKPRPYQVDARTGAYDALREHRAVLVVMPTGTGKTVLFASIIADCIRAGRRVLVLAHREELLEQAREKIEAMTGHAAALEQAERTEATPDSLVVIASVQSMVRRLDRFARDRFDLVIHDEAHRSLAPTSRQILDHFDSAKVLGFTATPNRGDERALGQIYGAVGFDMSLADAVSQGWLVPPRVEVIELAHLDLSTVRQRSGDLRSGELGEVLSEVHVLREAIGPALGRAHDKQTLVFCATRAHMACVAECIVSMSEERLLEVPIAVVDGTTAKTTRAQAFADFRARRVRWLLNVDVATEGTDLPEAEVLVMLRPTLSHARYMQMVGRGLRPLAGVIDGVDTASMLVHLDRAEALGADVEHLASHRLALMDGEADDAIARRLSIALSPKPRCLILDYTGANAGRHDLVSAMDLLGGEFSPVERREAEREVREGRAPNLWAALEAVRARRAAHLVERQARAGDPFALFGLRPRGDLLGKPATAKQRSAIDALRSPRRIEDAREANMLLRELARRDAERLCSYPQAALLARLGHPIAPIRAMSRAEAAKKLRAVAKGRWSRPASWA